MPTAHLFITCIADTLYPHIGEAVVQVLERVGVEVKFLSEQTCCAQPAYNAGYRADARAVALNFINRYTRVDGDIVVPSGSCAAMIKHGYLDLFAEDVVNLKLAQEISARTFEFSQYLVHRLNITDVGATHDGTLTYHPSCHLLRGLHEHEAPLALLRAVRGATLVELPNADDCCGFGGLFSIKMSEISGEMMQRKIENLQSTPAPLMVTCDAGCLTHLNGGLHRLGAPQRVVHLAEILAQTSNL